MAEASWLAAARHLKKWLRQDRWQSAGAIGAAIAESGKQG